MGISQRIRNIFTQTQESAVTIESQPPSLDQFSGNIRDELARYQKRQIPGSVPSSKEAAIERLQHAQEIAMSCQNEEQPVLSAEMTEYFKDNFYLTDYLHLWLNIDSEKLHGYQQQKIKTVEANVDAGVHTQLILLLEEKIATRKEVLLICLDKPEFNLQMNEETREEVINRAKTAFFMLNPILQNHLQKVAAQVMNPQEDLVYNSPTERATKLNDLIDQEPRTRRMGVIEPAVVLNRKMTVIEKPKDLNDREKLVSKSNLNKHNQLSSVIAAGKESANDNNKKAMKNSNPKITVYKNNQKSMKRRRFVFIRRQLRKLNFKNRQKVNLLMQQIKADKKASKRVGDYFGYHR